MTIQAGKTPSGHPSPQNIEVLLERLQARRSELEQTILTRADAVSGFAADGDPVYLDGLRAAVSAALGYALAGIKTGDSRPGPIPTELVAQVRLAAAKSVSLDTVLRRYLAGHTMFANFLIQEAEGMESLDRDALQGLLQTQAALVDHLVAIVAKEYEASAHARMRTSEQRRAERVRRLLAGELIDPAGFGYDFDIRHIGLVAAGPGAERAIHMLTATLERRRLLVSPRQGWMWAWLQVEDDDEVGSICRLARTNLPANVALALGDPAHGLDGWRRTHRQAAAALPVALRGHDPVVRHAEVALLATALRDQLLAESLREGYLRPLATDRGGGEALLKTLRAYFDSGGNLSSTAAALGVSRHTVKSRLRTVEGRLCCRIEVCAPELETALDLRELERVDEGPHV